MREEQRQFPAARRAASRRHYNGISSASDTPFNDTGGTVYLSALTKPRSTFRGARRGGGRFRRISGNGAARRNFPGVTLEFLRGTRVQLLSGFRFCPRVRSMRSDSLVRRTRLRMDRCCCSKRKFTKMDSAASRLSALNLITVKQQSAEYSIATRIVHSLD